MEIVSKLLNNYGYGSSTNVNTSLYSNSAGKNSAFQTGEQLNFSPLQKNSFQYQDSIFDREQKLNSFGLSAMSQSKVSGILSGGASAKGKLLAIIAEKVARTTNTTGWCFSGVCDAVHKIYNRFLQGRSAYMAANELAVNPSFREIRVSPENLKNLAPGTIVVWDRTSKSPHGHISVALGDGREASDHIQKQFTSLKGSTNYRVFLPL